MNFPEPHTEAELAAIEILKNAKIETDEDYIKLAHLLDESGAKFMIDSTDESGPN